MGKEWDKLDVKDWELGGFSNPGIGDREIPWPVSAHSSPHGTANPTCAVCGGRLRGAKRCTCEQPHDHWKPIGSRRKTADELTRNIMNPTSPADIARKERYGNSFRGRLSNLPDLGALGKRKPKGFRRMENENDVGRDNVFGRTSRTSPEYESYAQEIQAWHAQWLQLCFDNLPSGGLIKVFSATRTFHRLAAAMEQVGFVEIDLEAWAYGSGFPKSKNVALSVDKKLGMPDRGHRIATASRHHPDGTFEPNGESLPPYQAKKEEAQRFEGWGTALKPAWEPFIVGRKP